MFRRRLNLQYLWPLDYDPPLSWDMWVYSTAHDSESFFWRILGLEITWWRQPLGE